MRTTVTFDADTHVAIKQLMAERGISFKQAVNDAIRAGTRAGTPGAEPFKTKTYETGEPLVDLTHASDLLAEAEAAHHRDLTKRER